MRSTNRAARLREAESIYREALEMRRKLQGNNDTDVAYTLTSLAHNLGWQGNEPEAEKLLREALAICRNQPDTEGPASSRIPFTTWRVPS